MIRICMNVLISKVFIMLAYYKRIKAKQRLPVKTGSNTFTPIHARYANIILFFNLFV